MTHVRRNSEYVAICVGRWIGCARSHYSRIPIAAAAKTHLSAFSAIFLSVGR
jgi:hypothetical protein